MRDEQVLCPDPSTHRRNDAHRPAMLATQASQRDANLHYTVNYQQLVQKSF